MEKFSLGTALIPAGWTVLLKVHPFTERTLAETLIGGQAFRWYWQENGAFWVGTWGRHAVCLRLAREGPLEVACLTSQTTPADVLDYLALERLADWTDALPLRSDPVLAHLHARWAGLSLLQQAPEETLLAFICSANKQISQIRQMLHALSERFGSPLDGTPFRALPDWNQLARARLEDLRACSLGYRAAYVSQTARILRQAPAYLPDIDHLSLTEARARLLALPGVGPKVADCVLLFGYGRGEAFPVDTWIEKILIRSYPDLAGWTREQLATFARIHFGRAAGLAQQWFFAEARSRPPA